MTYPLEALLRPAFELRAAVASSMAAVAVLSSPSTFSLTTDLAWGCAGVLACHAAWRASQGWRILRYRRNLRRLTHYAVTAAEVPCSSEYLFLGRGFRWDQRHTQRLYEARLPENQYLLEPGFLRRWLRKPSKALSALGGDPAIHGVEPAEKEVWMNLADRVGHTLVLGTTRVGKTRLAELLITQDILKDGDFIQKSLVLKWDFIKIFMQNLVSLVLKSGELVV